jgi:DNA-binding NarL/FixJ family response regulator
MPSRTRQPATTREGNSRSGRTPNDTREQKLSPASQTGSSGEPRKPERPILSPRQRAVANLVSRGLTDCEIAAMLEISENTVGDHLKLIFRRFGLHTRTALAVRVLNETNAGSAGTVCSPGDTPTNVGIEPIEQTV